MPVEIRYMLAGTASPVAVNDVALEPTALIAELKDLIKAAHPQALRRFDSTELELFLIPPDLARGFQRQFLDDQVSQEAVQVITNATPPMMAERSLHDVSTSSSLQIFVVVPNSIEDTKLIRGALPFFTELPLIKLHRGEWLLFLSQIPGTTQHKMLVRPCLREVAGGILVGSCPPQQKKKHFVVSLRRCWQDILLVVLDVASRAS